MRRLLLLILLAYGVNAQAQDSFTFCEFKVSGPAGFWCQESGSPPPPAPPDVPILFTPANGSINVSLTPVLDWFDVVGATSYGVVLDNNSDFSSAIVSQLALGVSTYTVPSGLSNGTTYYWKARATNAQGSSSFSFSFSFTTIPLVPGVPTLNTPSNTATGISLTPTLDWTDVSGATTYNLLLDNNSDFSSLIVNQTGLGTSTYNVSSGLANSIQYYWKVSATNAAGTSSYSSTFSFTTIVAIPAAPTLVSPANSAIDVSLTPTLDWSDVSGASTYNVVLDNNSDFSSLIVNQTGLGTSTYNVPSGLTNNVVYYWKASATNAAGTSGYSSTFSFTTIATAPLGVPTLLTPANSATNVSITPTLDWTDVAGATLYGVLLDNNSDFSSPIVSQLALGSSTYSVLSGLSNNTVYYWKARSSNAEGNSAYSTAFSFTTIVAIPGVPTLNTPVDSAVNVSITPVLDWTDVAGATTYGVLVDNNSDFSSPVISQLSLGSSTYSVLSGLSNNTVYYWKARATNVAGSSAYTTAFRFTTIVAIPSAPTLENPIDSAINVISTEIIPLGWSNSAGATTYNVQVSTSVGFGTTIVNQTGLGFSTYDIPGSTLAINTQYFWRASATNIAGTSSYSSIFSFTTLAIPAPPVLNTPAHNVTDIISTEDTPLDWDNSVGAATYNVQVSTSIGFETILINQTGLVSSTYTITASTLDFDTEYWWRALATNAAGSSAYSSIFKFTTVIAPPLAPNLVAPTNHNVAVPPGIVHFSWDIAFGAEEGFYDLQLATDAGFTALFLDLSTQVQEDGSSSGEPLISLTTYYWRVRGSNLGGSQFGAWSAVWDFTIAE